MDVAVLTGGASGFGAALGAQCAAGGMAVAVLDLDGDRAEQVAHALTTEHGVPTLARAVDVTDATGVDAAAEAVGERFGAVDVLVSNVGVQLFGSIESFTDDEWRWVLDANVIGAARVVRSFLPLLRRAGRGHVAFTSSSSVHDPASRLGAYQASKFAVWGLAETLRLELAGEDIGVTVVFPSAMSSRHLETSEAAQPDHVRRPVAGPDDFDAMLTSNPALAAALATPEEAAVGVLESILADEPYVVTHGDLRDAIVQRAAALGRAAEDATGRTT